MVVGLTTVEDDEEKVLEEAVDTGFEAVGTVEILLVAAAEDVLAVRGLDLIGFVAEVDLDNAVLVAVIVGPADF